MALNALSMLLQCRSMPLIFQTMMCRSQSGIISNIQYRLISTASRHAVLPSHGIQSSLHCFLERLHSLPEYAIFLALLA